MITNNFPFQKFEESTGKTVYDAEMLGHVGIFANDAPKVCGGKNFRDHLNTCYEFNTSTNR